MLTLLGGMVLIYVLISELYIHQRKELLLEMTDFAVEHAGCVLQASGEVHTTGNILYIGDTPVNNNTQLVDQIAKSTGFECVLYAKSMLIAASNSSTNRDYQLLSIGTEAPHEIAIQVLEKGRKYTNISRIRGTEWLNSFMPIRDKNNNIVGMVALMKSEDSFNSEFAYFRLSLATILAVLLILMSYVFISINNKIKSITDKNVEVQDISDKLYKASQNAERSQKEYEMLFNETNDLIQAVDMEGRFIFVNKAWEDALEYSVQDLDSITLWDVIHPEFHGHCVTYLNQLKARDKDVSKTIDIAFVSKSGDAIQVNGSISVHYAEDGSMTTRGIFRNDTEQKLYLGKLKERERQYRLMVESVDDIIFQTDVNGYFTYVNEKGVAVTGYSNGHLLKMNYLDIVHHEKIAEVKKFYEHQFKEQVKTSYLEFPINTIDGQMKWVGQSLTTVYADDDESQITGYHAVARDVTALKEQQTLLKQAHDILDQKNKEITSSISYAKMIQNSMLPPNELMDKLFKKSFVIYMPKDIVSGDFYWVGETETHKVFAVGDCTGHGVPGAFMTVIGLSALNQIVNKLHVNSPAKIMSLLDDRVALNLNNATHRNQHIDGMDISICSIHKKTGEVLFSGSRRPLILLKSDGIKVYEGGKKSIGESLKIFEAYRDQTIAAKPGDRLFVFSDGMTDQFGGEEYKKFSRNRLKELILSSKSETLDNQSELIFGQFLKWKGLNDQTDDAVMMGIEL